MACNICGALIEEFGRTTMVQRHEAIFFRCTTCGFIQVDNPVWLSEAYESPITRADVGIVDRSLNLAKTAGVVIECLIGRHGRFLDYGGGAGLFTRLMRDAGYDFFWYDRHCQNLYAGGFSANPSSGEHYDLVTAVEVFEHLLDPLATARELADLSNNVLFTTQLIPDPPPNLGQWWYYAPEHGQHIAFYSRKSLQVMADKLGLHYATNGHNLHLFSSKAVSSTTFKFLTYEPVVALIGLVLRRRSLLPRDIQSIQRQVD